MKKLLTNGCSHTEGSECNVSFGDFFTNYEHVNIAKGGGGNERILRTTMEYCDLMMQTYKNFIDMLTYI